MDATTNKRALYQDAIDDTEQNQTNLEVIPLYNATDTQRVDSLLQKIKNIFMNDE